MSSCPARWAGVSFAASCSPQLGAGAVVVLLDEVELEVELVLELALEVADELREALAPSVVVDPDPPASQAAAAASVSAARPVTRRRAWRAGCSVTGRTYLAGSDPTKRPRPDDVGSGRIATWPCP
jgi:hypothetical protein